VQIVQKAGFRGAVIGGIKNKIRVHYVFYALKAIIV